MRNTVEEPDIYQTYPLAKSTGPASIGARSNLVSRGTERVLSTKTINHNNPLGMSYPMAGGKTFGSAY